MWVCRAQAGPVWEPHPQGCPPHACRRYFDHRHVICLRRWGLFTAPRATGLRSAAELPQHRALARAGHSGLVHLLLRVLHLISPGRAACRHAQCCRCTCRPHGPLPRRSVQPWGPLQAKEPPPSDPPSPLCMESVLLVTQVVSGASVVWQPQTLGGWASPGDLAKSWCFCSGGAAGTGGLSLAGRRPATCSAVFCSSLLCTAAALSCPCAGCPKAGLGLQTWRAFLALHTGLDSPQSEKRCKSQLSHKDA